jgi:putative transposase
VSYEAIRQWCQRFSSEYARILRRRQGRLGDTWHVDELFVNVQGRQQYLWRAVDQDGDVIGILVQPRRDRRAAERFFRKLLKGRGRVPRRLITDKLRSYSAAHGLVRNLFRVGRHLLRAAHYRLLRTRSFLVWNEVACAC